MNEIHDIRPPVPVGLDPALAQGLVWGGIMFLSVLLLFFLIRWFLKKRRSVTDTLYLPDARPPYELAMDALERLSLQSVKDLRLFYYDLTLILRRYMGSTFDVHAAEMTSEEFIRMVKQLDVRLSSQNEIFKFQHQSDLVKYAGMAPEKEQAEKDLSLIRDIMSQIEQERLEKLRSESAQEKEEAR